MSVTKNTQAFPYMMKGIHYSQRPSHSFPKNRPTTEIEVKKLNTKRMQKKERERKRERERA